MFLTERRHALQRRMSMRRIFVGFVLALAALASCADEDSAPNGDSARAGDCTVRIEFEAVVYRPDNRVNDTLPRAGQLGNGQPVDCDGQQVPDLGTVTVVALKGIDPAVAVAVNDTQDELSGTYVAVGVTDAQLPDALIR